MKNFTPTLEKNFNSWFSDYSEKYNYLEGWEDHDNYLDEVEFPEEISLAIKQKWLRDDYKIHITITSISQESWQYHITEPGEPIGMIIGEDYETYEEALKEAVEKALTIIQ